MWRTDVKRVPWTIVITLLATACTRPAEVRNVAISAQPLVANLQRMSTAAGENMTIQRRDLSRSAANFDAIRRDQSALVQDLRATWLDAGRNSDVAQLERLTAVSDAQAADPLATLRPPSRGEVHPPVRVQLDGLTTVAKALDRLKGEQGLTSRELAGFVAEVVIETNKIQAERAGEDGATATPKP
jgi:hypothetical protein